MDNVHCKYNFLIFLIATSIFKLEFRWVCVFLSTYDTLSTVIILKLTELQLFQIFNVCNFVNFLFKTIYYLSELLKKIIYLNRMLEIGVI